MCIMHAPINRKTINVHRNKHDKKERTSFNEELLKPDPNFVDERKTVDNKPEKKGFFAKILSI